MKASSWRACWAGVVALLAGGAAAQTCQPGWAEGFTNVPGFDGEVRGIAYFNEGGADVLYAAGHFSNVGGQAIRGIARWNGEAWVKVGTPGGLAPTGSNTGAYTISVLDLGSGPAVYIGGNFTSANGAPAARIARWDGQTWSALGAGFSDTVRSITTYDDGTGVALYASGLFQMSGETPVRGIARWTGSAWAPVGGGLVATQGGPIGYTLKVLDMGDGPKLYVGGWFQQPTASGVTNNIVRWDGTQWTGFGPGVYGGSTNGNRFVMPIRLFDFGAGPQLTVGGCFTLVPGTPGAPRVARWTGSQWQQVGSDLGAVDEYVNSLVEHDGPQGRTLYVGGSYSSAVWLNNVKYIARLGAGDWVGLENGMDNWLRSIIIRHDAQGDHLLACGIFTNAGSSVASRIAEWDGSRWNAPFDRSRALSGPAYASAIFDDGSGQRLYVGGQFGAAGTRIVNNLASWDGAQWESVGGGVQGLTDASVRAVLARAEPTGPALYAAGRFMLAGSGPCLNIARWDGAQWSSLGGNGPDSMVNCLAEFNEGPGPAIFAGGQFGSAGGQSAPGVARWDGTQWSNLKSLSGTVVYSLLAFDDGVGTNLYAAGTFGSAGTSSPYTGVARWDGILWTRMGNVSSGGVALALGTVRDRLVVGGRFTAFAGVAARNVAQWSGTEWLSMAAPGAAYEPQPGEGVFALVPQGRELWVGGSFYSNGPGGSQSGLVRWSDGWVPITPALGLVQPGARTLVSWNRTDRRSIFIGGLFTTAGGQATTNFAEYYLCECPQDCNGDGSLSVADFGCFQTRFALGDAYADFNQDGVRNLADFGAFQSKFAMGCP